jgi:hypothetical protein
VALLEELLDLLDPTCYYPPTSSDDSSYSNTIVSLVHAMGLPEHHVEGLYSSLGQIHGILKNSRDKRRKQPTGGNSHKLGSESRNQLIYGADRWFLCTIGTFTTYIVHTVIGR